MTEVVHETAITIMVTKLFSRREDTNRFSYGHVQGTLLYNEESDNEDMPCLPLGRE